MDNFSIEEILCISNFGTLLNKIILVLVPLLATTKIFITKIIKMNTYFIFLCLTF